MTAVLLLALLSPACGPRDEVAAAVESAMKRSAPADGQVVVTASLTRRDGAARADWEVETSMPWSEYRDWLPGRFPEFEAASDGEAVVLRRVVAGDTYHITLQPPRGGRKRAGLSFIAQPF
jgi:hypothetical protein